MQHASRAFAMAFVAVFAMGSLTVLVPQAEAYHCGTGSNPPCPIPPAPPCPTSYDYANPDYATPPQSGVAPNRCPVAKLSPDQRVDENCSDTAPATNCWGQAMVQGVTFTMSAADSYDPDGVNDAMYFEWDHIATRPSAFAWNGLSAFNLVDGCDASSPTCTVNPPYLRPVDPLEVVLVYQVVVYDRDLNDPSIRRSVPAIVNITVTNSNQPPIFVDLGNPTNVFSMECLPASPIPCENPPTLNTDTGLWVNDAVNIVEDRGHTIQIGTYYIEDEANVVSVDAYFVDLTTKKVQLQTSLQRTSVCSPSALPERCMWRDQYVRPGYRSAGIPVDTPALISGRYDVRLVAHDAQGGSVATEEGNNVIAVLPGTAPGKKPELGLYGVRNLAAKQPNHCFTGDTQLPQQVLGPGQQLRINVTMSVPPTILDGQSDDAEGRKTMKDPYLYVWKVTTQVCTSYRGPQCTGPDNACPLIGEEIPLTAPYLLRRENLPYGAQEIKVRVYDRFRQVTEAVIPIAFLEEDPEVKVVLPQRVYNDVEFPLTVLTHDPVDHRTLLAVSNLTGMGSRQQFLLSSTGAVLHVPRLGDAIMRDVTGDRMADFLLDLDGDGLLDHYFDYKSITEKAAPLTKFVVDRHPTTRLVTYYPDLNANGRRDGDEARMALRADADGKLHFAPAFVTKCATVACLDKEADIDGDGKMDDLVDRNPEGDGFYDHFVRDSSTTAIPFNVTQVSCFDFITDDCLVPFDDVLDIDGDGKLDVTVDADGDGVPEMFLPFGSTRAIDLLPSGVGWTFFDDQARTKTYSPATSGPTIIGFLREAPSTVFVYDITKRISHHSRWEVNVDDVTGHSIYRTGTFSSETATVDLAVLAVNVTKADFVLKGDTVELSATVAVLGAPPRMQAVTSSVFFDNLEGTGCKLENDTLTSYPPRLTFRGPNGRACLPAALYDAGVHTVEARVELPEGIIESDPGNNVATGTFEVFLGKVIDGNNVYYIRSDGRGLPEAAPAPGAFRFDEKGRIAASYQLELDQSQAQAVYRFKVPDTRPGQVGERELYWDPQARAHPDGKEAWSPTSGNGKCRIAVTGGETAADPDCRLVTVVAPPPGASPTVEPNDSPAGALPLVLLGLLGLGLVARRRRRA